MPPPPSDFDSVMAIIRKLQSADDQTFEAGLQEAVSLVKRGDEDGLEAINKAIINLSADENFTPYKPGMVMASGAEYSEARAELLALAAKKQFLKDPHKTQKLIAAFKFLNSAQDFAQLTSDVYQVGGSGEAHALLLLTNEMWCQVQLSRKNVSVHTPDATSAMGAANHRQANVIRSLIREGANVDEPDRDGRRPLWSAASNGHIDAVRLLVESGADINAVDNYGTSALASAVNRLSAKAINVPHKDQWTNAENREPSGLTAVVEFLIHKGADVNQAKRGNYTPADIIRRIEIPRLVALLRGREKPRSFWSRLIGG